MTPELKKDFRKYCAKRGMSMTDVVNELIANELYPKPTLVKAKAPAKNSARSRAKTDTGQQQLEVFSKAS